MKRVELRLAPGGVHPVYELLTTSSSVERASGVHRNVAEDGTLTMLHRVVGDVDDIASRLERIEQVQEYEVLRVDESDAGEPGDGDGDGRTSSTESGEAFVYLRDEGTDDSRRLFRALSTDGILTVGPIEYDETGASFTVVGTERAITRAHRSVPEKFDVAIESVGGPESAIDPTNELSDRQREAARVGVELGYFDVPRRASHEDVARELGCSSSTAAEHLQKASSRVIKSVFE